jgi:flagellar hook assembly protein FlgD
LVLNTDSFITLEVFDMNGTLVRTVIRGQYPAGYYNFEWDGGNDARQTVNTGVYFYHATTGSGAVHSGKIVMIK